MEMYALTFCYEGVDDNAPFATTIAVSESVQRLREEMAKCVEMIPESMKKMNGMMIATLSSI